MAYRRLGDPCWTVIFLQSFMCTAWQPIWHVGKVDVKHSMQEWWNYACIFVHLHVAAAASSVLSHVIDCVFYVCAPLQEKAAMHGALLFYFYLSLWSNSTYASMDALVLFICIKVFYFSFSILRRCAALIASLYLSVFSNCHFCRWQVEH